MNPESKRAILIASIGTSPRVLTNAVWALALGVFASPRVANPRRGRICDCLAKWWNVPRGVEIPAGRQRGIVDSLMARIEREIEKRMEAACEKNGWCVAVATLPPVAERIDTFKRLAGRIGKERVIWRFDPLLLSDKISIDVLLDRIAKIGRQLKGYTEKLIFSFIDIASYRKVQKNLAGLNCRELSKEDQVRFAQGLSQLNIELSLELATCAEQVDLSAYGIKHNKCVDDELMMRLFHNDAALMDFIGAEYDMLDGWQIKKPKKDKGQRKACGCMISKDIGMYNTCRHFCVYCYANTSKECVLKNVGRHNDESESLIG